MEQRRPTTALLDHVESVGAVIAGVGHRINDPLAYVLSNVALLHDLLSKNAPSICAREVTAEVFACLAELEEGATRIAHVAKDLRVFSRIDDGNESAVDVTRVCEAALGIAANRLQAVARVRCELGHVPPIVTNEGRLAVIVLELLVDAANAIEACGGGDHEVLICTGVEGERAYVEVARTASASEDDGATARRTREVSAIGGEVQTSMRAEGMATVRVSIPLRAMPRRPKRPSRPRLDGRRGRVLLVDDEPTLMRALQRVLAADHDVTIAASGRAALEHLSAEGPFDVVLTDVMMPEISGIELYETILARHPLLAERVVFLTGGVCSEQTESYLRRSGRRCVEKPFRLDEVRDAVDAILRRVR